MPPRHIVVGVDACPAGRRALDWALRHADGTDVVVVTAYEGVDPDSTHVSEASPSRRHRAEAARHQHAQVDAAMAECPDPPVVITKVLPGPAARVLSREAADADLLVVGSHGHGPIESRLLGTVSSECIRWSPCPVVVIPVPRAASPDAPGEQLARAATEGDRT